MNLKKATFFAGVAYLIALALTWVGHFTGLIGIELPKTLTGIIFYPAVLAVFILMIYFVVYVFRDVFDEPTWTDIIVGFLVVIWAFVAFPLVTFTVYLFTVWILS